MTHALLVMFDGPKKRTDISGLPIKDFLKEEGVLIPKRQTVSEENPHRKTLQPAKTMIQKYSRLADYS